MRRSRVKLACLLIAIAALLGLVWIPNRGGDRDIEVYQERFHSLFRGPIEFIGIYDPERFTGDLGAALARFGGLRHLEIRDHNSSIPEADWKRLCEHLRKMPNLQILDLRGAYLTDAALAPLAGHRGIRSLDLGGESLTTAAGDTVASLPQLSKVTLSASFEVTASGTIQPASEAEWAQLCAQLRGLPHLETLEIQGEGITDASLASLRGHPALRHFSIRYHNLSPSCGRIFATLPNLRVLDLPVNPIGIDAPNDHRTSEFCASLRPLPLETLTLSGDGISDTVISGLKGHPTLARIEIQGDHTLTAASSETFATLPRLTSLSIFPSRAHDFRTDVQTAIAKALPAVRMEAQ